MTARCAFVEAARGKDGGRRRTSPRNYVCGYVVCVCGYCRDARDVNHFFKLRLEASGVECRKGRTNKSKRRTSVIKSRTMGTFIVKTFVLIAAVRDWMPEVVAKKNIKLRS